ncbi:MAG: hypothetical protein MUE60_08290, partial [Candidatus Eisenbacteria bacterium]|nr:hypothetical protein [Candidatus Eisenbacteria bacterium]
AGQAYEGVGMPGHAARHYERLARFWGSDWDLWVKVVSLYRDAGRYDKAYDLAAELIRIHRREPRLYTALLELGDSLCIADDARERIREQYAAAREDAPSALQDERDHAFLTELVRGLDAAPDPLLHHCQRPVGSLHSFRSAFIETTSLTAKPPSGAP